jgi:CBS domain containing-hemolysin-like protein
MPPPGAMSCWASFARTRTASLFGRIPIVGERVRWDGWEFEVAQMQDRRVARILAKRR